MILMYKFGVLQTIWSANLHLSHCIAHTLVIMTRSSALSGHLIQSKHLWSNERITCCWSMTSLKVLPYYISRYDSETIHTRSCRRNPAENLFGPQRRCSRCLFLCRWENCKNSSLQDLLILSYRFIDLHCQPGWSCFHLEGESTRSWERRLGRDWRGRTYRIDFKWCQGSV